MITTAMSKFQMIYMLLVLYQLQRVHGFVLDDLIQEHRLELLSNYGRVSFTIFRDAQASVTVTMATAHPQGTGYAVFASSARPFTTVENAASGVGARTSTSFQIVLRNTDFSTLATDTNAVTFMVV